MIAISPPARTKEARPVVIKKLITIVAISIPTTVKTAAVATFPRKFNGFIGYLILRVGKNQV